MFSVALSWPYKQRENRNNSRSGGRLIDDLNMRWAGSCLTIRMWRDWCSTNTNEQMFALNRVWRTDRQVSRK